jgi:hypothetical protein
MMRLRDFGIFLCSILSLSFLGSLSSSGQDIPEEYVNVWEYYDADTSQVLSVFSDGSFIFYSDERSSEDVGDEDCERRVEASRGRLDIRRRSLTLIQESSYRIDYPACGLRIDGDVSERRSRELEFSLDFDEDSNQIILDDIAHTGRYTDNRLVESVEISSGSPIPTEFLGTWTNSSSATFLLRFLEDGRYFREFSYVIEGQEISSSDSGQASIDDLVLRLAPEAAELIVDGEVMEIEIADEQNIVWLAFEEEDGLILYLNGLPNFFEDSQSVEVDETVEGGFYEDFESNDEGWEEGSGKGYVSEFDEGVYHMAFTSDNASTGWIISPGFTNWDLAPQFEGSYRYQFDFRGECSGVCGIGMVFGMQAGYESGGYMYYWPLDDSNGFFRLFDEDSSATLEEGEPYEWIDIFDGDWHTLRLEISEDSLGYWIDAESIFEYEGSLSTEGSIAFVMVRDDSSLEFDIEIDNLSVEPD